MLNLRLQGDWKELKQKALKYKKDPWSPLYLAEAKLNLEYKRHVQFIQWDQVDSSFVFESPQGIPWTVNDISGLVDNWLQTSVGSNLENSWVIILNKILIFQQGALLKVRMAWMQRKFELAHQILSNTKIKESENSPIQLIIMFRVLEGNNLIFMQGWILDALGQRADAFTHFRAYSRVYVKNLTGRNLPNGKINNEISLWKNAPIQVCVDF